MAGGRSWRFWGISRSERCEAARLFAFFSMSGLQLFLIYTAVLAGKLHPVSVNMPRVSDSVINNPTTHQISAESAAVSPPGGHSSAPCFSLGLCFRKRNSNQKLSTKVCSGTANYVMWLTYVQVSTAVLLQEHGAHSQIVLYLLHDPIFGGRRGIGAC